MGLLMAGWHRSRAGIQVLVAMEEEGPSRWFTHTARPKPSSSRHSLLQTLPLEQQSVVGSDNMLFLHHQEGLCCECNPLLSPNNLPQGDFSGLLVFSQNLLQTWDGNQPGCQQPPKGRSSLPSLLHSLYFHVQVATPCDPSSGSPSTSHSFCYPPLTSPFFPHSSKGLINHRTCLLTYSWL